MPLGFSSKNFTNNQRGYKYYRWQITNTRGNENNALYGQIVQVSEFVFRLGSMDQSMTGITITNPSGLSPAGEEVDKLIDGNTATKFLDGNIDAATVTATNVIFQFNSPRFFTGYRWATGNDEELRDPKDWTIAGSDNGTTWTTLHTKTNYTSTSSRSTYNTAEVFITL